MTSSALWDLGLGQVHPSVTKIQFPGAVYSPPGGLSNLRGILADLHKVEHNQVTVTLGASMALVSTLASIQEKNRGVLIPRPYYPAYPRMCDALGIRKQFYGATNLSDAIGRQYSAIVINTPGNPLGNVHDPLVLGEVCREAKRLGARVVLDLVYRPFEVDPIDLPADDNILQIYSLGKSLGIPGERLGYVIGSAELVREVENMHWALGMGPPMTGMVLATKLLQEGTRLQEKVQDCVNIALRVLNAIDGIEVLKPKGGYFIWVNVPKWQGESGALADWCFERGVKVIPANVFGSPLPAIRVCAALGDATHSGFRQLAGALRSACAYYETK